MSDLSDRLRYQVEHNNLAGAIPLMAEAAAELDRLTELLGPIAYQTDARWALHIRDQFIKGQAVEARPTLSRLACIRCGSVEVHTICPDR